MRGPRDPVRRAFSVEHKCLWNTGSPAFAGDDGLGDDTPSRSRGALRPRFCYLFSFTLQSEGAGNGRAPMRRGKNARVVATVTPEHPAFPAQWFIRLLRAHPGDRALLPPSPARRSAGLTPRRDVRSTRLGRPQRACPSHAPLRPTTAHPTFVTFAKRPSELERDAVNIDRFAISENQNIVIKGGLTDFRVICLSGRFLN